VSPTARTLNGGTVALQIQELTVDLISGVAGGAIRADVVEEVPEEAGSVGKHLGQLRYEDVSFAASLPLAPELSDWVTQACGNPEIRRDIAILDCERNRKLKRVRRCFQSTITRVAFPALNLETKDPALAIVTVRPGLIRVEDGDGSTVVVKSEGKPKSKKARCSDFRLSLGDLDCRGVTRIEGFIIELLQPEEQAASATAGAPWRGPRFPNLSLDIAQPRIQDWERWADEFLVQGDNRPSMEKSGAIEYLDPSLNETLFRVDLSQVGICLIGDAMGEPNEKGLRDLEVTLYVERMGLSGAI
jgi:hypothetical protein